MPVYEDRAERGLIELIGHAGDEDDLLGVDRQLQELSDRLLAKLLDSHQQEPFVIGLYGEWGSGKSFWQKQIRYKLLNRVYCEDGQESCFVVPIEFNAWRYEKEDHLIIPLLKTTVSELERWRQLRQSDVNKDWDWREHLGRIASEIRLTAAALAYASTEQADEARLLEALQQAALNNDSTDLGSLVDTAQLESRYIDFQDNLKRLLELDEADGKKKIRLVFFIDDLDRCLPDKAIEMLEALKLFLDIEGTAYVMAIDDEVVDRGILHRYSHLRSLENDSNVRQAAPITGDEYLEKIIHLQVHLDGTADDSRILEFLNKKCPELVALDSLEIQRDQPGDAAGDDEEDEQDVAPSCNLSFRAFLKDFPKVPRKLLRLNELYQLRKNVLDLSEPEDQLILLRMVALQLFVPRVYRSAIRRNAPDILNLMGHWREKYREEWPNFDQLLLKLREESGQLQGPELHRWLHVTEPLLKELAEVQGQRAAFDPSILAWPYAISGSWLRFVEGEPAPAQVQAGETYLSLSESELQEIFSSLLSEAPSSWRETMSRAPRGRFFAKDHQKQLLEAIKVRRHGGWSAELKREWLALVGPFLSKAKFEEILKKFKVSETAVAIREGRESNQSLLECWLESHLDDISSQQLLDWSQKLDEDKQITLREQWLADNAALDKDIIKVSAVELQLPEWANPEQLVNIVEEDDSAERRQRAGVVLAVLGDPRPEDQRPELQQEAEEEEQELQEVQDEQEEQEEQQAAQADDDDELPEESLEAVEADSGAEALVEESDDSPEDIEAALAEQEPPVAALDDVGEFAEDEDEEEDEEEELESTELQLEQQEAVSTPESDSELQTSFDDDGESLTAETIDNAEETEQTQSGEAHLDEDLVEQPDESEAAPAAEDTGEASDEAAMETTLAAQFPSQIDAPESTDADDTPAEADADAAEPDSEELQANAAALDEALVDEAPVDEFDEAEPALIEDSEDDDFPEQAMETADADATVEGDSDDSDMSLSDDEIQQAADLVALVTDDSVLAELDDQATPPLRRLEIGDAMDAAGDDRVGVGLDKDGIPDIDWVWVPAASGLLIEAGAGGEAADTREVTGFLMSRYPVTNAQFEAFVRANEHDEDTDWWNDLQQIDWEESQWPQGNRPKINVSWFEAMAFCQWLSGQLSREISLPAEEQWLAAATGAEGRAYPWGEGQVVYQCANVARSADNDPEAPQQTSAVGIYPAGQSPEGVADLAGNVLEWCLNKFEGADSATVDDSDEARVLRGGSWRFDAERAQCSTRGRFAPDGQLGYVGFRIVCVATEADKPEEQ